MKYLIVFIIFILALFFSGYYFYMFDKKNPSVELKTADPLANNNNKKEEKIKNREQMPEYLTDDFWKNTTPEQLKEKLKNIKSVNGFRLRDERTMLHLLVLYGKYPEMIGMLISAGADSQIEDRIITKDGHYIKLKPLFYALSRKEQAFEFTNELLKYDSNVNAVGFIGGKVVTPLTYVAFNRASIKLIKLLLEKGADPNFPGVSGSPLISASVPNKRASFIDPEAIQLLLDHKANIIKTDETGKTAYDYMKENPELVKTELFKKLSEALPVSN